MDGDTVGIRKLGQVAVPVQDVTRATSFYGDVLGLRHLFDAPPSLSFFDCGGVRLMLTVPETGDQVHASSILYLDVADISAAADALIARGVRFEAEPHEVADLGDRVLWLGFFRDPDSNLLALMSEPLKRRPRGPGA